NMGSVGVTGSSASNALAEEADVVLAVGTRLQDFTTGSWALFKNEDVKIIGLNVQPFDAHKHNALPMVGDARVGLQALDAALMGWQVDSAWTFKALKEKEKWIADADAVLAPSNAELPSDAQVIGSVQRARRKASVICASGGLAGELHKLWQANAPGSYHLISEE